MILLSYAITALPLETSEGEENEGQLHMPFDNLKAQPTTIIYAILQLNTMDTKNSFPSGYVSKNTRFLECKNSWSLLSVNNI